MPDYVSKNSSGFERRLSLINVWSLAFGCIVGWGAYVMPGTVFLKRAGPFGTLIAMETAALIMLIMSYNYAYMMKRYPVSGGEFVYAKRSFGDKHGFICAWFLSLCYISIIPMNATALCLIFRALKPEALQFGFHYVIAGYDIYLGEVLLALSALIIFALVSMKRAEIGGKLQTIFVIILLCGIGIVICGIIFNPSASLLKLQPMFHPKDAEHGGVVSQIISVLVVAPWAYVGYDIVPKLTSEAEFEPKFIKSVMDTSILCGCFVYTGLTLTAAIGIPESYSSWVEYIADLPKLSGAESIATFSAARQVLGQLGVIVISISGMMAMLTGILGFYVGTSRLLYAMSKAGMLPEWFSELNANKVPGNAVKFCLCVSSLAPFVGRNALGWTVDMSSIGGAVSLGYTSLSSMKIALAEGRTDMKIFGSVGFIFSVIFVLLLLVPVSGLNCSLEMPSYILLIVWVILGMKFYSRKY